MNLTISDLSLVVLAGVSGSGKSTFARRCFAKTEILSSDENAPSVGKVKVADLTSVRSDARRPLVTTFARTE